MLRTCSEHGVGMNGSESLHVWVCFTRCLSSFKTYLCGSEFLICFYQEVILMKCSERSTNKKRLSTSIFRAIIHYKKKIKCARAKRHRSYRNKTHSNKIYYFLYAQKYIYISIRKRKVKPRSRSPAEILLWYLHHHSFRRYLQVFISTPFFLSFIFTWNKHFYLLQTFSIHIPKKVNQVSQFRWQQKLSRSSSSLRNMPCMHL